MKNRSPLPVLILGLLLCFALVFLNAATSSQDAAEVSRLIQEGQHQAALAKLDTLLSQDPSNEGLHLSRGLLFQSLGRFDEAITSFERARGISKNPLEASYSLALVHEAKAYGQPGPPDAHHLRGALRAWEDVVRAEPSSPKAAVARRHMSKIRADLSR